MPDELMPHLKSTKRSQNDVDNISDYIDMIEDFVYSNDISNNAQEMALFLTAIGEKSCKLLHEILALKTDSKDRQKYVKPKPTIYEERYKFYARNQEENESVFDYITALHELSINCKFESYFDDALRDKFVCGLSNADIRSRLLAETSLTLKNAIDMACSIERDLETKRDCSCCGSRYHLADVCRFKHVRCFHCNQKGHLSKACHQPLIKKSNLSTPHNGKVNFSTKILIHEETRHDSTEEDYGYEEEEEEDYNDNDFFQRYLVDNGSYR